MFCENISTPIGTLSIEASDNNVFAIKFLPGLERPNHLTNACKRQLAEYFRGERQQFDIPLDFRGTKFQKIVWEELLRVEFSETASYSDIAARIGRPNSQRAVGGANHRNPLPIIVPCHRIIGKKKSLVGYAFGLECKAWLLGHEKEIANKNNALVDV